MEKAAGWYPIYDGDSTSQRWWDGQEWSARYAVWNSAAGSWDSADVPPPPPLPTSPPLGTAQGTNANWERTLVEMSAIGKGMGSSRIVVTTRKLEINSSAGVSVWRTLLATATVGASAMATGITRRGDGTLEVPVSIVDAAAVGNEKGPWADLRIIVSGESASFNMSYAGATVAARAINAAVAGGEEAELYHAAWVASRVKRSEKPRHARSRLREELRTGKIAQTEYDRGLKVLGIESSLRMMF